jgi:type I restriction enzyme S subunit
LISSILLYQYIIDDKVWLDFTLKTETRSGTFPQGNYEELSSIKVPFGAETSQISSVLENLYSRIFNNEKESNLLSSLRDTLLPKLMSGELRVPDTDLINEMLEKGIR